MAMAASISTTASSSASVTPSGSAGNGITGLSTSPPYGDDPRGQCSTTRVNAQQALKTSGRSSIRARRLRDAIADARLRNDQVSQRSVRIGGRELAPEPRDVDVEVVALVGVGGAPDRSQEAGLRQQPSRLAQHRAQQLVLPRRELKKLPVNRRDPAAHVDREAA